MSFTDFRMQTSYFIGSHADVRNSFFVTILLKKGLVIKLITVFTKFQLSMNQ